MTDPFSRRDLLKGGVALVAATRLGASTFSQDLFAQEVKTSQITPLTSTSGVYIPPRGESFFKFSYDFPEPSVEFAGLQFGFRVFTFENTYGLDAAHIRVLAVSDVLEIECSQFVWAGGQMTAPGHLKAIIRKHGDDITWQV